MSKRSNALSTRRLAAGLLSALGAALGAITLASPPGLDPAAELHLESLQQSPDAAGSLIQQEQFEPLIRYITGGTQTPIGLAAEPGPDAAYRSAIDTVARAPAAATPAPAPASPREAALLRPKVHAVPKQPYLGRFAFLMHPMDMDDMVRCMPVGCERYASAQAAELRQWILRWHAFDGTPSAVHHLPQLASRAGGYVDGWLISCMLPPRDLMRLRPAERAALMQSYLDTARAVGATTIGLGAFTSVITRGGLDIADCEIPLTTGNSLTAMMCVQGLARAAQQLGRPLRHQTVAIIGAAGSVGRLTALEVAAHCRRLQLFGNPGNPTAVDEVKSVAGEIYQELLRLPEAQVPGGIQLDLRALHAGGPLPRELLEDSSAAACLALAGLVDARFAKGMGRPAPITVSVDLQGQLQRANAIISATSQGKPFVQSSWIADDTIVCDAARPGDVGGLVRQQRQDLFVFDGGLVQLPEAVAFGRNNVLGFAPGINLACLSETMALAMGQVTRHYSLGRRIPLQEARYIQDLAQRHGFACHLPPQEPADLSTSCMASTGVTSGAGALARQA